MGNGGFADLMALSASQTQQSAVATQTLLAERQRKEAQKRKEQEEKDRKERDFQAKLVRKRFEDERRELERQQLRADDERQREMQIKRREEEQRNTLLYGPKKAKTERPSGSESRPRKPREGSPDSMESGAAALTREEKRQRRMQLDMTRGHAPRRSTQSSGYSRAPKMLRGGAIDATGNALSTLSSSTDTRSVKQRIAAIPNTLTKLNVVKRDTRTIDEILQDRAKARETKVLDGDEAREFHDWFTKPKKKEVPLSKTTSVQASLSPSSSRAMTPNPPSKASGMSRDSPAPVPRAPPSKISAHASASVQASAPIGPKTVIRKINVDNKPSAVMTPKGAKTPTSVSASFFFKGANFASRDPSAPVPRSSTSGACFSNGGVRKRPRSPSESPPPSPKKRTAQASHRNGTSSISTEIWKLFGKDRDRYVNTDVLSDDDDMEVDADALRREELRSARLAKREDEEALEMEKRHEEEKRRRKKEKEARERRG